MRQSTTPTKIAPAMRELCIVFIVTIILAINIYNKSLWCLYFSKNNNNRAGIDLGPRVSIFMLSVC